MSEVNFRVVSEEVLTAENFVRGVVRAMTLRVNLGIRWDDARPYVQGIPTALRSEDGSGMRWIVTLNGREYSVSLARWTKPRPQSAS